MRDSDLSQEIWADWVARVSESVGVDPTSVNVAAIHELTRVIAQDFVRPMAPVSAYIWGLAIAANPGADPADLAAAIISAIPEKAVG